MTTSAVSLFGRAYVAAIPALGVLLVGWALRDALLNPPSYGWVALTAATAAIGAYTVKIPGLVVRLSLSEPTVFLATLLYGPAAGTLTAAVDALVMSLRLVPRLRTPHRILFNVGTLAASVLPASLLFFRLAGIDPRAPAFGPVESFVGPLYAFALCVFAINSGIVAVALGVERASSPIRIWCRQFPWLSANYLASASIAAILVVFSQAMDFALAALLLPLVVVSFLAFRTTLGRLDDANQHLTQVNQLYLSTIETLAMAIDAKDQVTHGHIRRVQRYAVALARVLGVSDEQQIKAIEAAALLHDMGKLAIPEFILNKPGKLTEREFSVMKTHAAVGADLLSSIHFPYPVVPIVRHHHENWDGSGYPDGLRGAEIPIGARILAVVDCFDALTSDRPYRPAMTPEFALEVLSQRRGRMYDPLVVDAFVREHAALRVEAEIQDLPTAILATQIEHPPSAHAHRVGPPPDLAPIEALRLLAHIAPFPDGPSVNAVCRQIVDSLRGIASFDTGVLFCTEDDANDLAAVYADGSAAAAISGTRLAIGERLTGWVAANKTSVWNSDAALDLTGALRATKLTVGSSLPLCVEDELVGVLTLYGTEEHEITVAQRRAVEWLLPTLAASLATARHRPAAAVDCRTPDVRASALAALDGLLSHDRHSPTKGQGCVVAISLAVAPSLHDGANIEELSLEVAALLSPQRSKNRCVLLLGPGQLLLCALDAIGSHELLVEAAAVNRLGLARATTANLARIDSPLELQDRVKRMLVAVDVSRTDVIDRVH